MPREATDNQVTLKIPRPSVRGPEAGHRGLRVPFGDRVRRLRAPGPRLPPRRKGRHRSRLPAGPTWTSSRCSRTRSRPSASASSPSATSRLESWAFSSVTSASLNGGQSNGHLPTGIWSSSTTSRRASASTSSWTTSTCRSDTGEAIVVAGRLGLGEVDDAALHQRSRDGRLRRHPLRRAVDPEGRQGHLRPASRDRDGLPDTSTCSLTRPSSRTSRSGPIEVKGVSEEEAQGASARSCSSVSASRRRRTSIRPTCRVDSSSGSRSHVRWRWNRS